MCGTCGCTPLDTPTRLIDPPAGSPALGSPALGSPGLKVAPAGWQPPQTPEHDSVQFQTSLYAHNRQLAMDLRHRLMAERILLFNLVSSPGAGKTTLLVATLRRLAARTKAYVIEGDQQTELDALRIRATGTPALQINTGQACHLDAQRVSEALEQLRPETGSLVFIENVGNLICPAHFDLGEALRVVLLSVTEGDDKALKYPDIFASADLVLITKCDLLPYVDFNLAHARANIQKINPNLEVLTSACGRKSNLSAWLSWLTTQQQAFIREHSPNDHPA
jgi:hydrogenase nickel incorporation protein HypB